jgi:TonB family protein
MGVLWLVPVSFSGLQKEVLKPAYERVMNLRVFEGIKESGAAPAETVTSSYLRYTLSTNIETDPELEKDQNQIRATFNLKDVKLLTESSLHWKKGDNRALHLFRLDGHLYEIALTAENLLMQTFKIEVYEQKDKDKASLLETKFTIPKKNIAVFGFEDSKGKPYFLSLKEEAVGVAGGVEGGVKGGVEGGVLGGVEGGVKGGVEGGVSGGIQDQAKESRRQEFEKDAVSVKGLIKQPKIIKMVKPVYPEAARKNGIRGVVILEAKIDEAGRVIDAMILRSIPALDQAALDAVTQWTYEPLLVEGKPRKAVFTVTVNFTLDGEEAEQFAAGAVKVRGVIKPPKPVKVVKAVYPEIARQAAVEGVVIVEARTDVDGRVKDVRVLRSVPLLNQAAIDAVRQWVYEPMVIDGTPREVVFTVTVRFALDEKGEKAVKKEPAEVGETVEPQVIKKVNPVYPEVARKAGIQGTVLLEATTDEKGDVVKVRVLKSIPELDQAAIDALKQWKYEPYIIDGKPVGITFTVTIRFNLK